MTHYDAFLSVLQYLPFELSEVLRQIPESRRDQIQEIRLRSEQPLSIFNGVQSLFVSPVGALTEHHFSAFKVSQELLKNSFVRLCDFSVHTHQSEVQRGFITTPNGDRVGVCACAVQTDNGTVALREVSSLNIRIAREVNGCADKILRRINPTKGLILAGAPSTGKTTLLRDLARSLGSGALGRYYKLTVIDERYEFSAMYQGQARKDVGVCSDILCGLDKAQALELAIRTLSPELIICDEIGSLDEVERIRAGLYAGIAFMVSVHCGEEAELYRNPIVRALMETGAFETVMLLDSPQHPSQIKTTVCREEYDDQVHRIGAHFQL